MSEVKNDIPVIKTFMHDNKYFMYDTYTNRLFGVAKDQYLEIIQLQKIGLTKYMDLNKETKPYEDIMMLINKGLMKKPFIEKIEHPETEYIEHLVDRCINDITLQVTRDCNFKCRYCLYASDNGIDRNHENLNMSWETAKKSIDFLYSHAFDTEVITIAFYGGEPLLNFKLIVDVVEYAEKLFYSKKIEYRMTINGSILTDDIIEFIVKYNFLIVVSLDGPEEIQNRHRKFCESGNDTFKVVYENVKKIKGKYEDYFNNNVSFMPVVFPDENYQLMITFFTNLNISEGNITPLMVDLNGVDYTESRCVSTYELEKNKLYNINKVKDDELYVKLNKIYNKKSIVSPKWHHNGSCIPAIKRVFVDVKGVFYQCERIVVHDALSIGDVENGLNMKKVIDFLNIGKLTESKCKTCWAIRFCEMCIAHCNDVEKNKISSYQKNIACDAQENKAIFFLKQYINL